MEMKKPNRLQGLLLFFWVIYINKSSIKSQPTNQPKRKRFLAPKPKNSRQIFATVEFKPSVKKKSTNISNLALNQETEAHTEEKRNRRICLYDRGLELEASLETRVHASCP